MIRLWELKVYRGRRRRDVKVGHLVTVAKGYISTIEEREGEIYNKLRRKLRM